MYQICIIYELNIALFSSELVRNIEGQIMDKLGVFEDKGKGQKGTVKDTDDRKKS